jgi:hypothetical protein
MRRMKSAQVDAVIKDGYFFSAHSILSDNIRLHAFRYGDNLDGVSAGVLPLFDREQTLVIRAKILPKTAPIDPESAALGAPRILGSCPVVLLPATARNLHSLEKSAVGSATATQDVLAGKPSEADHHVTTRLGDGPGAKPGKAPKTKSSAERDDQDVVGNHMRGRRHTVFATKQVDLVPEIAQAFGCLEQIPLGSAMKIQPFMNQRDLHDAAFFRAFTTRLSDSRTAG